MQVPDDDCLINQPLHSLLTFISLFSLGIKQKISLVKIQTFAQNEWASSTEAVLEMYLSVCFNSSCFFILSHRNLQEIDRQHAVKRECYEKWKVDYINSFLSFFFFFFFGLQSEYFSSSFFLKMHIVFWIFLPDSQHCEESSRQIESTLSEAAHSAQCELSFHSNPDENWVVMTFTLSSCFWIVLHVKRRLARC